MKNQHTKMYITLRMVKKGELTNEIKDVHNIMAGEKKDITLRKVTKKKNSQTIF